MYGLNVKKNVGRIDMIIRIILGTVLITFGSFRVFPGHYFGAAAAVLLGAFLLLEGALRY